MAIAPHGNDVFLWFSLIFVFPAIAVLPVFVAALAGLAFRRFRIYSGWIALCSFTFLVGLAISIRIGESVRTSGFHRLAERSKPLIAAIRAFEQTHGHPPLSLQALVPDFMVSVPATGMGASPEYRYSINTAIYHGNPWVITIFTPSGGINFDRFIYFPLTNYPKVDYGGWLERVGDWAYVHE